MTNREWHIFSHR